MKILVTGDRNWDDPVAIGKAILETISEFDITLSESDITVVHGAARGADSLAGEVSKTFGFRVLEFPAQWNLYGRAAGPIRNQQMLDENPDIDVCLSFHKNLNESKGTRDMVNRVTNAGIVHKHYDGS